MWDVIRLIIIVWLLVLASVMVYCLVKIVRKEY